MERTPVTRTPPSLSSAPGHAITDEEVARLSPFKDRHVNFQGRYQVNITAAVLTGACVPHGTRTRRGGAEEE
ncbi:hypothetical protein [Streptomyces sp. NPDC088180]|uniref:hypothetical protein n=1 Tax=Streptomyces sp. NPDC088180 TaxID=3365837 RepID=UPI003812B516